MPFNVTDKFLPSFFSFLRRLGGENPLKIVEWKFSIHWNHVTSNKNSGIDSRSASESILKLKVIPRNNLPQDICQHEFTEIAARLGGHQNILKFSNLLAHFKNFSA